MNLVNNKELDDDLQSFLVSHVFLRGKNYRPSSREEFDELVERCKADLVPQAEKVDDLLHDIFKRALSLTRVLKGKNIPFDKACSMADIKKNLGSLIHGGFIYSAGWDWLIHYPRYIEAMALRLEKLPIQINKDRQWTEELGILQSAYSSRLELLNKHKLVDENIIIYRWMLEEYRVSLFAQQLGTCFPISDKRLRKAWLNVQDI